MRQLAGMVWLRQYILDYLIGKEVDIFLIIDHFKAKIDKLATLLRCKFVTISRLVDKINCSIGQDPHSKCLIGVLDIYGFESFKHNRLQLQTDTSTNK